jgi:uncharacterized protein (TIRG00374 family)
LKLALGLLILVLLVRHVEWHRLRTALGGVSLPLLGVSFAILMVEALLVTHKWRLLLVGGGVEAPFWYLYKVYIKSGFLAFFVPSAISGDVYKGLALTRRVGAGQRVASSIVLERLLGLLSTVTLCVGAVAFLPAEILGVSTAPSIVLAAVVTAAGLFAFLHADRFTRLGRWVPRRWHRLVALLDDLGRAFGVYRSRTGLLVETYLLSLVIQVARCTAVWVVALALHDSTSLLYFLVLVPFLYLVNMLPFASSRVGVEQGTFVLLFASVGMRTETALAVSLLATGVSFLVSVPGGVWLFTDRPGRGHHPSTELKQRTAEPGSGG